MRPIDLKVKTKYENYRIVIGSNIIRNLDTYLKRIEGLDTDKYRKSYADATVWDALDPSLMTLCSPDPQAFRPPDEPVNVLQVRLPTNFKSARFDSDSHTEILRKLETDIEAARFDTGNGMAELPVKLRVHESIFVPMAKLIYEKTSSRKS